VDQCTTCNINRVFKLFVVVFTIAHFSATPCIMLFKLKEKRNAVKSVKTDLEIKVFCNDRTVTLRLLGCISRHSVRFWFSAWERSTVPREQNTSPMMSSREYRSKLSTTKCNVMLCTDKHKFKAKDLKTATLLQYKCTGQ
jgi:hypothetical protein